MRKQSVKVVIRTRPTPNFASKNIQIDPVNSVSLQIIFLYTTRYNLGIVNLILT